MESTEDRVWAAFRANQHFVSPEMGAAMERAAIEYARYKKQLRSAFRFHLEHGGYTVGERALCAMRAARAELEARARGWRYVWEDDRDGYRDAREWEQENNAKIERIESCTLEDEDGEYLASLCGIWDADANYRRVVEAELALEAL